MDLFDSQSYDTNMKPKYSPLAPLAVRMRPRSLDELIGQEHVLGSSGVLRTLIEGDTSQVSSVILWGPPGCGKTTLAYLVANNTARDFVELSAVTSGVAQLRQVIENAKYKLINQSVQTVLFIDEIHRFSKSQQDALLPAVENHWVILIAATTENPHFCINSPLLSRSILLTLKAVSDADIKILLQRAVSDSRGLNNQYTLQDDAADILVAVSGADCRKALNLLEAASVKASSNDNVIDANCVLAICDSASVRYDVDQHYDTASAFIKSIRGSDVDAALHYLAVMIEGGEDLKFIVRRILISAAEDIGLADPDAITVANSACQAALQVGFPEARILLSQAVIYLCLSPKSNSAYVAIDKAISDVKRGMGKVIPKHLADAHYSSAKSLGHGLDYKYPHNYPNSIVEQQYLPQDLIGVCYYKPSGNGKEKYLDTVLGRIKKLLKKNAD